VPVTAFDLREPAGVEQDLRTHALDVPGLVDGRERAGEAQVERDAVLSGVALQPQLSQRLDDLDAKRPDGRRQTGIVVQGVRGADRVLRSPAPHNREGVHHTEVRVDAQPGDEQHVASPVVCLEDAAVVEVAVAGSDVAQRQRRLVDGVLVERRRHLSPPRPSRCPRASAPGWRGAG
jgi:hypothetical protein